MELLKSTNYHLINFNFRSEVPATNEISVRGGEGKRQKDSYDLSKFDDNNRDSRETSTDFSTTDDGRL